MPVEAETHCPACGLPVEEGVAAPGLGPQVRPGSFPIRDLTFHPACAFGHAIHLLTAVKQRAWRPNSPMRELAGPPLPPPPS